MSEEDRERWDARYTGSDAVGREVPAWLREAEPLLPGSGDALDLACGTGAALIWLAGRGLGGAGIDISGAALALARARAAEAGLGDRITWQEADLDGWEPGATRWDVVCCLRFLDRALIPAIRRAVRPGGLLVMEVLATEDEGGPRRYRATPNELLRWFVDWRVLRYAEDGETAALIARKPPA